MKMATVSDYTETGLAIGLSHTQEDDNQQVYWEPSEYFYHTKAKQWYHWAKTHWEELTQDQMVTLHIGPAIEVMAPAPGLQKLKNLRAIATLLSARLAGEPDFGKYLSFENGHLDLKDYKFYGQSTSIKNVYSLPYKYDKNAKAPEMLKILRANFPNDEELLYVITVLGTLLCPDIISKIHLAIFDHQGEGDTGKTFLTEHGIAGALGEYSVEINQAFFCGSHPDMFESAAFEDKLMYYCDDLNEPINDGPYKRIVGAPHIKVRKMHTQGYKVVNTGKLFTNSNDLPTFKGKKSKATYNRLCLIPFSIPVPAKDKRKYNFYEAEYPGIINLLVMGAKLYRKANCNVTIPKSFLQYVRNAEVEDNNYNDFISAHVVKSIGSSERPAAIFKAYNNYLSKQNIMQRWNESERRTFYNLIAPELRQIGAIKEHSNGPIWRNIKLI